MGDAVRVALMTPYTGTNLGDWAIQEAAIANIRERYPDVSLHLVTIFPVDTEELHGVPSVPINCFAPWPGDAPPPGVAIDSDDEHARFDRTPGFLGRLKETIKSARFAYSILKPTVDALRLARDESRHVGRTYRFLKGMDLLVVSGGGQLDEYWGGPWDHPYALFKWGLLAKLSGTRFIVLSVGTCALESNLSLFFIRQALRLASYRSYRDRRSKELLHPMEFTRSDAVYPDLAFSYSDDVDFEQRPESETSGRVVGVSPIAYLGKGWPKQDEAVFRQYFETLTGFVRTLLERGYSVVLFSTDGVDRAIVSDMVEALENEEGLDTSKLRHPRTHTLPEFLEQVRQVDYVVASRLHGVILSHRLCLPVLAVSYDRKVDTHMEDVGLSKHTVDIHDLSLSSLVAAFDALISESQSIRSTLRGVNDRYERELRHQYDAVLGENAEAP